MVRSRRIRDLRAIMNEVIEEAFAVASALDVPLPFESAEAYRAGVLLRIGSRDLQPSPDDAVTISSSAAAPTSWR